jgi:hypothetical protein
MEQFEEVPIINATAFLSDDPEISLIECKKVALSLHNYGILIWKDPRVNESDNEDYIDLMENYFE